MNAHKFVADFGIEKAKAILDGAPHSATHFNQNLLGGHYAKEVLFKNGFRWACYNKIAQAWYYDFAEHNHFELSELKQVVESVDLIESYGGITKAKAYMTRYFKLNAAFRNDYPKTGICITQQMSALQNAIAHAEK